MHRTALVVLAFGVPSGKVDGDEATRWSKLLFSAVQGVQVGPENQKSQVYLRV